MWGLFTKETRGQKYGATVPFILERGPNESKHYRYSIEKTALTVLSQQSCPVLAVLYGSPMLKILYLAVCSAWHLLPVQAVLFCMSFSASRSACPVLAGHVLALLFWLFCPGYSGWLFCPHCNVASEISRNVLRNFFFAFREIFELLSRNFAKRNLWKFPEILRKWSYKTVHKLSLSTF